MACSKERGRSLCAKLPNKDVDGTGIIPKLSPAIYNSFIKINAH